MCVLTDHLLSRVTLDKSVSAKLDYFHLKNQASKLILFSVDENEIR